MTIFRRAVILVGLMVVFGANLGGASHADESFAADERSPQSLTEDSGLDVSKLTSVGKGIRYKKIVFVSVKVYEAELLVSEYDVFKKTYQDHGKNAVSAVAAVGKVAMRLRFLREVGSDKVHESFLEGLARNGVKQPTRGLDSFMKNVSAVGTFKEGDVVVIGADLKKPYIQFITGAQTTQVEATVAEVQSLFSIWLGKTDSSLGSLQKELLASVN